MLQTLNPYPNTAKTARIMARYRPIAPKPDVMVNPVSDMTPNIIQSPYLRNVWPHLQARPTRTRKRGRTSVGPPPASKRSRTFFQGLSPPPPPPPQLTASTAKNFSLHAFAHSPNALLPAPSLSPVTTQAALVTLSLLPSPNSVPIATEFNGGGQKVIDLNMAAAEVPQEKDFLHLLQGSTTTTVIAPQPVRPIGSSITIRSVGEDPGSTHAVQLRKKAEEVEEEIESENLPAVVTDSNNKVRLVNSAYKEMVGQPECLWLDSMVTCDGRHGGIACKRICGEVKVKFLDSGLPIASNRFSCWAMIEWGNNGKKRWVDTACKAMRLYCESKDYLLAWRFHTREVSKSASNV